LRASLCIHLHQRARSFAFIEKNKTVCRQSERSSNAMKKLAVPVFLSLFFLFFVNASSAQTRPRRVENPTPPTEVEPIQTPTPERKKPVLIGDGQKQAPTKNNNQTSNPNAPIEVDENEVVRIDTTLVMIPVSVMDRNGNFVSDVRKEEFRIFEDGIEQQVAYFSTVETPFTVALLIDMSGSTKNRLSEIQGAAMAFVEQLRSDDRVMVIAFDDHIDVLCEATNDRSAIRSAIYRTDPGNGTRLYDAVDFVINQKLNRIQGRKAIVLFTDGVDTTSKRASFESTLQDAEELDALIYPIQYDTYNDVGGGGYPSGNPYPVPRKRKGGIGDIIGIILGGGNWPVGGGTGGGPGSSREDYERAERYLGALARSTGAKVYREQSSYTLRQVFGQVAEELRKQYSLGYYPKNSSQAGQRHHIRVRVMRPNLAVRARDSYITGETSDTKAQKKTPIAPFPRIR
jgi:VWFA-related protein